MTTPSKPTSKFVTVNGLRLHYLDWGNAGAPPVVCVHGYTSSAQAFNALARQLQDRFHVIAPDVRGHGESAWSPAGEYQFTDQVSDLAEFVDQLGLVRFTLIGTSMGGIIANGLCWCTLGAVVVLGDQRYWSRRGGWRPEGYSNGGQ
ncbi:MAG TPA: alpha/beta hydrolase [Candidatus Binatia bacterium]|nr:alpha/beta hydrolase [Candidatus Binatia bacterium]